MILIFASCLFYGSKFYSCIMTFFIKSYIECSYEDKYIKNIVHRWLKVAIKVSQSISNRRMFFVCNSKEINFLSDTGCVAAFICWAKKIVTFNYLIAQYMC